MCIFILLLGGVTQMYSSDVLSFANKDGKIIMEQRKDGTIDIIDEKLKKQVQDVEESKKQEDEN